MGKQHSVMNEGGLKFFWLLPCGGALGGWVKDCSINVSLILECGGQVG